MPTLHLPAAHTDTDVALATEVAQVVGSHELYVTWTHGEGPGLPPEIEAVLGEEPRPALTPFAEVIVAMVQGISALWNAIVRPASTRPAAPGAARRPPRPRRALDLGRAGAPAARSRAIVRSGSRSACAVVTRTTRQPSASSRA